jgi:hypothetical protein
MKIIDSADSWILSEIKQNFNSILRLTTPPLSLSLLHTPGDRPTEATDSVSASGDTPPLLKSPVRTK